eukprot:364374-Chlamydomonas_euryale.AAC.8
MHFKKKPARQGSDPTPRRPQSRRQSLSRDSRSSAPDLARLSMSSDVAAANSELARMTRARRESQETRRSDGAPESDQKKIESLHTKSLLEINHAHSASRVASPTGVNPPPDDVQEERAI